MTKMAMGTLQYNLVSGSTRFWKALFTLLKDEKTIPPELISNYVESISIDGNWQMDISEKWLCVFNKYEPRRKRKIIRDKEGEFMVLKYIKLQEWYLSQLIINEVEE